MANRLRNLTVNEVSLVTKGANQKRVFLMKMDTETTADTAPEVATAPEAVETPVAKTEESAPAPAAEAAPATPEAVAAPAVSEAEIAKADVLAKVASLEKALAEAKAESAAKVEALEKALNDEREAKEVRESIAKAAKDFAHLPVSAEDLGPTLRAVRKVNPEAATKFEALLSKVDALLNQTLAPVGSTRSENTSDSAWDQIQKLAREKVAKNEFTSIAKAIDAVLAENKDLYTAHLAERN